MDFTAGKLAGSSSWSKEGRITLKLRGWQGGRFVKVCLDGHCSGTELGGAETPKIKALKFVFGPGPCRLGKA